MRRVPSERGIFFNPVETRVESFLILSSTFGTQRTGHDPPDAQNSLERFDHFGDEPGWSVALDL